MSSQMEKLIDLSTEQLHRIAEEIAAWAILTHAFCHVHATSQEAAAAILDHRTEFQKTMSHEAFMLSMDLSNYWQMRGRNA
jgi:hypothetical protein